MTIHCEMKSGAYLQCPWKDNGYCHYVDENEVKKRRMLAKINFILNLQAPCPQHKIEQYSQGLKTR